jgi:hypothetical protein
MEEFPAIAGTRRGALPLAAVVGPNEGERFPFWV